MLHSEPTLALLRYCATALLRYCVPVHFAARYRVTHFAEAWSPSHETELQVYDADLSALRRS
jgi:hypothetical protein